MLTEAGIIFPDLAISDHALHIIDHISPKYNSSLSVVQLIDLAKSCWDEDPQQRPTMTRVCEELKRIEIAMKQRKQESALKQQLQDRFRRQARQAWVLLQKAPKARA